MDYYKENKNINMNINSEDYYHNPNEFTANFEFFLK